jgi:hypothetical protein
MTYFSLQVTEAFLSNKLCFLAEEPWLQVIRSAIWNDESFTEQKDLVFGLWGRLVRGPKHLRDATEMILSSVPPPQEDIDDLIEHIVDNRQYLLQWLHQMQQKIGSQHGKVEEIQDVNDLPWQPFESGNYGPRDINYLALQGASFMCLLLKDRVLFSLSPSRFHHLEVECQDLAGRIVGLSQNSTEYEGKKFVWSLITPQGIWIAKGILKTKDTVSEGWQDQKGMMEKQKFKAWCRAIGREFPALEESI